MELDDLERMRQLDPQKMIDHINTLPDQLAEAWALGQTLPLPECSNIQHVVVAGMGGSAIGADLLAAYAQYYSAVPITVLRDYRLPAWKDTLVICSSHSGNTEETLEVFQAALVANQPVLAITTGGELAAQAAVTGKTVWTFTHDFQPRAAVGFSFGLLLAALTRLGLLTLESAGNEVETAVKAMKDQQSSLLPEVNVTVNPAKRQAGQLFTRWVTIFASGLLAPVARRWKTQINEVAKAQAAFEILPEADHNTLQGIYFPEDQFPRSLAFFISSRYNHPRHLLREEHTRMAMMLEGIPTDFYMAEGPSMLADIWTALHFGDYVAYYLAAAYGVDPTPVPALQALKGALKAAG